MIPLRAKDFWTRFWMRYAGLGFLGRIASGLAAWFVPPYYGRFYLARLNRKGYISATATIHHKGLVLGNNVFIGDRVIIFEHMDGGPVELGEGVHVMYETLIQTGLGGSLKVGSNSHIHPRCQISAYNSPIYIGRDVQIAANCAFYPYDHGFLPDKQILEQPNKTKGGISIDDGAWLGFGVIVLDGVKIGKGAVIGAGSVVTHDIPDEAVAAGVPARVLKMRSHLTLGDD